MRLVTIDDGSPRRAGLVTDRGILDIAQLWPAGPATVIDILRQDKLADLAKVDPAKTPKKAVLPADTRLWAPVDRPGKIVCLGLNFKSHAKENNLPLPKVPILFSKATTAVTGPFSPIEIPPGAEQIDWEVELVAVIGRTAKRVTVADAMEYVAGYTIMNDVSARAWQFEVSQWHRAKSPDTFAPMGPALVTCDEAGDWRDMQLTCRVGRDTVQQCLAGDMIFGVAELVSFISQSMTLEPGDCISTGTPSGVGYCSKPQRFLNPGDMVECEITRLGLIRNKVVAG